MPFLAEQTASGRRLGGDHRCQYLEASMAQWKANVEFRQSILTEVYTQADDSHVVQTAWSCLALLYAQYPSLEPIEKGIKLIMSRQLANGEWAQERPVGSGILTWYVCHCVASCMFELGSGKRLTEF